MKHRLKAAKAQAFSAISVGFLVPLIDAFLAHQAKTAKDGDTWNATRLGREALKDPGIVFDLRNGRVIKPQNADKIFATIDRAAPGFRAAFISKRTEELEHAK